MKVLIKIYCSKENPKQDGEYFTDQGCINWSVDRWYMFQPNWWMKEINLSELMEEFLLWKNRLYPDNNFETFEKIINEFLTQKGLI